MKCAICEIYIESVEDAVEQNWVPFFYEGDEPHGPACADCSKSLLRKIGDGEMEVKERYRGKIVYHDQLTRRYLRRNKVRQ